MIAERCGEVMKLSHMELGSNDGFILLDDGDIDAAVEAAYKSRMLNTG